MKDTNENYYLQNLAYGIVSLIGIGWLLYLGSSIVIPFIFAILVAVFLYPIEQRFRKLVKWKGLSITLSFLSLIIPFVLVTTLFSIQLISIMDSLPSINESMQKGFDKILAKVNDILPFLNLERDSVLKGEGQQNLQGPIKFISQGVLSTTEFLAAFFFNYHLYFFSIILSRKYKKLYCLSI